ncbi:CHAT domain-containing protein [Leptolyngbya sp. AN02str]|uniref:CHAT domain-containing protein n=1 Tax=Leptolyngbya sp. AN02str TaxID=3423363 RepID=UPI003D31BE0E
MDIALLASLLSPFLPALLKLGSQTADKLTDVMSDGLSEAAWEKAQKIWGKLSPHVDENSDLKVATEQLAAKPDSKGRREVFQEELASMFERNPKLAAAIAQILQEDASDGTPTTQIIQTVTGNQNQVIGQVSGGNVTYNMSGSIDDSKSADAPNAPPTKTILILAANPKDTSPLRLNEEVREIRQGLERAQHRDRFVLVERWAITATDVRRALLDCKPQIVHFSGHGSGSESSPASGESRKAKVIAGPSAVPEGLMFEDELGQSKLVAGEAIANLLSNFAEHLECVVLNACYSEAQATAIVQHIPYVIGMKRAIGDKAAIEFSVGFYDAVLAGKSVEFAYKLGCNAIQLAGIPESLTPVLKKKD